MKTLTNDEIKDIAVVSGLRAMEIDELKKHLSNPIAYLREIDSGTDNSCWVVCAFGDPGAIGVVPALEQING